MNRDIMQKVVVAVGGALIGGGLTYIIARNRLEEAALAMANNQIEQVRNHYLAMEEKLEERIQKKAIQDVIEESETLIEELGYKGAPVTEELNKAKDFVKGMVDRDLILEDASVVPGLTSGLQEETPEDADTEDEVLPPVGNAFDISEKDPDLNEDGVPIEHLKAQDRERRSRPYTISVDEFMEGFTSEDGTEHDQLTVTWYDGDGVLVDEREKMIPDIKATINGEPQFGKVKNDPHVAYVRNEKLRTDFEIIRDNGSYSHLILGLDEDKLTPSARIRKAKKARDDE